MRNLRPRVSRFVSGALIVAFTLSSFASVARANAAMPMPESRPGERVGEIYGAPSSVHIEREELTLDLRPLARLRPAIVEAVYHLRNDGEGREIELHFVAAALAPGGGAGGWIWRGSRWVRDDEASSQTESGVWLDDRRIETVEASEAKRDFPKEWSPPATTPALEGVKSLPYETTGEGALTFVIDLAPGRHVLRVRYEARPSAHSDAKTTAVNWQLGYVLAPARKWESFGGLDAKILVPEGWRAASDPAMRREGDSLVASWGSLPSDSLAVTVQTDERTITDARSYWVTLLVSGSILTVLAVLAGVRMGVWFARRGRTSAWTLLLTPLVAAALVGASALISALLTSPPSPEQAAFNLTGGYDFLITFIILLGLFAWHLLTAQISVFIVHRRTLTRLR